MQKNLSFAIIQSENALSVRSNLASQQHIAFAANKMKAQYDNQAALQNQLAGQGAGAVVAGASKPKYIKKTDHQMPHSGVTSKKSLN